MSAPGGDRGSVPIWHAGDFEFFQQVCVTCRTKIRNVYFQGRTSQNYYFNVNIIALIVLVNKIIKYWQYNVKMIKNLALAGKTIIEFAAKKFYGSISGCRGWSYTSLCSEDIYFFFSLFKARKAASFRLAPGFSASSSRYGTDVLPNAKGSIKRIVTQAAPTSAEASSFYLQSANFLLKHAGHEHSVLSKNLWTKLCIIPSVW